MRDPAPEAQLFCIGTLPSAPQQSKVLGLPALLPPKQGVWGDLEARGYTVTSGKALYGVDFVVYEGEVTLTHATMLVNVVSGPVEPVQLARWQRLAQTVGKKMVVALGGGEGVVYYGVDRVLDF